jgi:hypothetical protein
MTRQYFGWAGTEKEISALEISYGTTIKGFGKSYMAKADEDPKGKKVCLWEHTKKRTGMYLPNIPQELGDCVGASTEMAIEYLQDVETVDFRDLDTNRPIYRPWLYGAGRVYAGKNRIRGDGSLLTWQLEAITKIGVLSEDEPGLPAYTTSTGREWGSSKAVLDKWRDKAAGQIIEDHVIIKNFHEAAVAINIYKRPLLIASDQGFRMELKVDRGANKSWFVPSGTWMHQMHGPGCDYTTHPSIYIGNQWGVNAHPGQLDGPDGGGWIPAEVFDRWLRKADCLCIAIGNFKGWRIRSTRPMASIL